jgi:hypothetical protein
LFLQEIFSSTEQPQTPVQNNFAFLQPQRNVVQPLLQEQDIISLHAGRFSLIALMLKNLRLAAVPAIIHTFAEGILGKCATRSNSTLVSLTDTTTVSQLLMMACRTSLVSASS